MRAVLAGCLVLICSSARAETEPPTQIVSETEQVCRSDHRTIVARLRVTERGRIVTDEDRRIMALVCALYRRGLERGRSR